MHGDDGNNAGADKTRAAHRAGMTGSAACQGLPHLHLPHFVPKGQTAIIDRWGGVSTPGATLVNWLISPLANSASFMALSPSKGCARSWLIGRMRVPQ